MKKIKLFLSFILLLSSLLFAGEKYEYPYLILPNAMIAVDEETYIYWFNIIVSNDYEISEELYRQIRGAKFVKSYRPAKIIEVSKKNKNLVRIKYQIEYSDEFSSDFWTHKGSLITVDKYNKRFL